VPLRRAKDRPDFLRYCASLPPPPPISSHTRHQAAAAAARVREVQEARRLVAALGDD